MQGLDVYSQVKGLHLISPQVIASATTTNGTGIDISKYEGIAKATLSLGTITGTQTIDVNIQTSDTVGGTYATVASFAQLADDQDNTTRDLSVDLRAAKAFIRGQVVSAGTVTALNIALTLHATKTEKLPV